MRPGSARNNITCSSNQTQYNLIAPALTSGKFCFMKSMIAPSNILLCTCPPRSPREHWWEWQASQKYETHSGGHSSMRNPKMLTLKPGTDKLMTSFLFLTALVDWMLTAWVSFAFLRLTSEGAVSPCERDVGVLTWPFCAAGSSLWWGLIPLTTEWGPSAMNSEGVLIVDFQHENTY